MSDLNDINIGDWPVIGVADVPVLRDCVRSQLSSLH
jgi:hypothetical protein